MSFPASFLIRLENHHCNRKYLPQKRGGNSLHKTEISHIVVYRNQLIQQNAAGSFGFLQRNIQRISTIGIGYGGKNSDIGIITDYFI